MVLSRLTDLYDAVASSYHDLWLPVIEPAGVRLLDLLGTVVAARPDPAIQEPIDAIVRLTLACV